MKESPKPTSCIELLQALKRKMKFNDLSVLVGAGFSKNVNEKAFPSWWELLRDIVMQMQGDAFRQDYAASRLFSSDLPVEEEYVKKKADAYLDNIGPLKVVSDYIKMKGFREVIDAYIEARTPKLNVENGKKTLVYWKEGEITELPLLDDDLSTHCKLIKLPWNNIYTTNYDNLLERCINVDQRKLYMDAIDELKQDLQKMETKKYKAEKRIEDINAILDTLSTESKITGSDASPAGAGSTGSGDGESIPTEEEVTALKREKIQLEGQLRMFDIQDQQWTSKLGRYEMLMSECLSTVTHSSFLAVKKNKNIIKLHGSLRESEDEVFGFDNDPHIHYIIAQEDYDTYPVKHEAFMQLMRISLLRESFCLVGFSGVDPNFLAWIGWVRDVIEKKTVGEAVNDYKIYFVDMSTSPASADKALFYRNHRIGHVTLMSGECIDFLLAETHREDVDRKSRKEVLNLFLDYLSNSTSKDRSEIGMEVLSREAYDNLTKDLGDIVHEFHRDGRTRDDMMSALLNNADKMDFLRKYNRIPSLDFSHDHFKYGFLRFADGYLEEVMADKVRFEQCLRVIEHFARDQYMPASIIFAEEGLAKPEPVPTQFQRVLAFAEKGSSETYARYLGWKLRNAVWNNNAEEVTMVIDQLRVYTVDWVADEIIFQRAWHVAFNLRFSDLFAILEGWNAKGYRATQKAGLLSLFSAESAEKLLTAGSSVIIQEELYALELRLCLQPISGEKERAELSEQISSIEASGLKDIGYHIKYLLAEATPKKEDKIRPYGAGKNLIVDSMSISNINANLKTLQILGVLMESGLQAALSTGYFIQKETLYPKVKPLIHIAPFPILFFLAQYSGEEFSKTVGEDYMYRVDDDGIFKDVSSKMQAACHDPKTPDRIKNNLLNIYSSLLLRLDPREWQDFAFATWNKAIQHEAFLETDPRRNPPFLFSALRFIMDPKIIAKIIADCLNDFLDNPKYNHGTVINCVYEINNNPFFKANAGGIAIQMESGIIAKTIERLEFDSNGFNVLGNLYVMLLEQERKAIMEKVNTIDLNAVAAPGLWRILVYFSFPDEGLLDRIKAAILMDTNLWNAGFTEQGISSRSDFIRLHQLRAVNGRSEGIQWTADEAVSLYNKLVDVFEKIVAALKKRTDLYVFKYILEEMSFFLEDERETLERVDGYDSLKQRLEETYHQQRKFSEIVEGLRSADSSEVVWSVGEFSRTLYLSGGMEVGEKEIDIILQRIRWKMPSGLLFCLEAVSTWIYHFRDKPYTQGYAYTLEAILVTYDPHDLSLETDFSDLEESLVKIAFVLHAWGRRTPVVKAYYRLLNSSMYNNVRYGLRYTLMGTLDLSALDKDERS